MALINSGSSEYKYTSTFSFRVTRRTRRDGEDVTRRVTWVLIQLKEALRLIRRRRREKQPLRFCRESWLRDRHDSWSWERWSFGSFIEREELSWRTSRFISLLYNFCSNDEQTLDSLILILRWNLPVDSLVTPPSFPFDFASRPF